MRGIRMMTLLVAAIVLGTTACGTDEPSQTSPAPVPANVRTVTAEALHVFPVYSLQDWVTYGDHLVEFTVTAERRLPTDPAQVDRGEGVVDRQVTLGFVDEPAWTRPTLKEAPSPPREFQLTNGGWSFHGDEEVPFMLAGQVWLAVGHRYIGLLTWTDVDLVSGHAGNGPEWIVDVSLPFDGNLVGDLGEMGEYTGYADVAGQSKEALVSTFNATAVEKAAEPYMDLDPVLRTRKAHP